MNYKQLQEQTKKHEREHSCKVLSSEIHNDQVKHQCIPIYRGANEIALDIWNMQLRSIKINDEFNSDLADKIPNDLLNNILDENKGAINMSGWYYPQSKATYDALSKIIFDNK